MSVVNSFSTLKKHTRIPNKYKKLIRKSKITSFIYPNKKSFRVVHSSYDHINFLNKFEIMYSTSANLHKEEFNKDVAVEKSDIIVHTNEEFNNTKSSDIYKISKANIKKIR